MEYQKIKEKLTVYKKEFVLAAAFIVVFLAGYGTGIGERSSQRSNQNQINYNTNLTDQQTKTEPALQQTTTDQTLENSQPAVTECLIKGTSSRIYHLPGGAFYDRVTNPATCFNSEAEAASAGYRKSSR